MIEITYDDMREIILISILSPAIFIVGQIAFHKGDFYFEYIWDNMLPLSLLLFLNSKNNIGRKNTKNDFIVPIFMIIITFIFYLMVQININFTSLENIIQFIKNYYIL